VQSASGVGLRRLNHELAVENEKELILLVMFVPMELARQHPEPATASLTVVSNRPWWAPGFHAPSDKAWAPCARPRWMLVRCPRAPNDGGVGAVPYLRCRTCGVLSYGPRNALDVTCPECGVPVTRARQSTNRAADRDRRLDRLLRMTRDLVDTDIALLTEIRDGREIAQRVDGDWPGEGAWHNASVPLKDTFCQRMLDGRIGNYVRDVRADPRVSDLAMARQLGVGAWLGVPIEVSDTRLYILCCLARESRPSIGDREVRLLIGLATSMQAELQAAPP
jgi:ribosomal protein L37E